MKTHKKGIMHSRAARIVISLLFLLALALCSYMAMLPRCTPQDAVNAAAEKLCSGVRARYPAALLDMADAELISAEPVGEARVSFRSATQRIRITMPDIEKLCRGLEDDIQTELERMTAAAERKSDVYTDSGDFRADVLESAYKEALGQRLNNIAPYLVSCETGLILNYSGGEWMAESPEFAPDIPPLPTAEDFRAKLSYIALHYALPDRTSPGPRPNPGCYGETYDPYELAALLETDAAQALIGGQTLDWSPEKKLLPDSSIHYYLDDTILAIVWQEVEHGAVGTFSEVFIADASQLRRKIANDTPLCYKYYYPTELSRQSNAVVALSADFYDHPDRNYGICVYDGEIIKYWLQDGDTCCFTDSGDMIFTYAGDFDTVEQAQQFMDDNKIMFSLSFGPVLIVDGVDVTPYDYPLGEILDTYARCCFGQLGPRHYLGMTINCLSPFYYVYVTLRQAADSMIAHGCKQAYTLDGGQTGSIIIGNELINPVQFGVERQMSDIFYFATAIPDQEAF